MSVRIALVGNPNCGKTTMFNALTGANQYVGNWPGVTVEKKEGRIKGDKEVIVTDLPGIYSLSPYTLEEVVSRDYLIKDKPEAIINLVDATNIERNLYLTTQVLELGIPVVIALNMIDVVKKTGDKIDSKKLGELLGCEVIETSALHGTGLKDIVAKAKALAGKGSVKANPAKFEGAVEEAVKAVEDVLPGDKIEDSLKRWYAVKLLENDEKVVEEIRLEASADAKVKELRESLEKENDDDIESIITDARYNFIEGVVSQAVVKTPNKLTLSDKIDRVVTNRVAAIFVFIGVMSLVYYFSIQTVGSICTDWVNDVLFGEWILPGVQGALESAGVNEVLISLIVDGIIGGVGAVLGFVPQMACVFLCLSILEDVGYMARVAFIMDRIFRRFGLSGKTFIPMLVSSGCGIPGIAATKTIENDNDRRLTIMTTTFVPCGAKLPIIALIGALLVGDWALAPIMYFVGIAAVLVAGVILKKTKMFAGDTSPFVMELPAYHLPAPRTILLHVWERLWSYIKKAGTIIFLACAVMWFLSTFGMEGGAFCMVEDSGNSLVGIIGGAIAWLFIPLGFGNWQAVAATISGLVAKESVVSTVSILGGLSEELAEAAAGEEVEGLVATANAIKGWFGNGTTTVGVAAVSFLIFNMLNSPCLAAIGTMAKEMNSKKWTWFTIFFQNIYAYVIAMIVYQIGSFIVAGVFGVWTIIAIVAMIFMLYLLFRPDPNKNKKVVARRSVA
ncbi:MAG: ferrous iron transport protein B [Lachnospiraceae bacterium]|nr:ferrous iron transport protein B [Lachnospiraceae bacterium]